MKPIRATTTLLRTITLACLLAAACSTVTLPCFAQAAQVAADEARAERPLVWTGRTRAAGAEARSVRQRIDRDSYARGLRQALAEVLLFEQIEGRPSEAESRFTEILVRAADVEDYPGRWELLVELALARSEAMAGRGQVENALQAARQLLLPARLAEHAGEFELVPASDLLLAAEREALADPRLVALRARLEAQVQGAAARVAPAAAAQDPIESAVRSGLATGQPQVALELGARAAPVLEAMVLEDLDALPAVEDVDPLCVLMQISELRGAQLVLERLAQGGFFFKKRVLRALRFANVLRNAGTWSHPEIPRGSTELSTKPPRLLEPVWLDVVGRLASDPDVARDSLELVGVLAARDVLTARLQRALIEALDGGDPDLVRDVLESLEPTQGRASVVPVLEHALGHGDAAVRAFAAERLAFYPRNDALRARADHPDLAVRRAVAGSLRGSLGKPVYGAEGAGQYTMEYGRVSRSVDERDLACLTRLLSDEDLEVRRTAVRALLEHPELSVPSELLARLARDPDVEIRVRLTRWPEDRAADPRVLEILAGDEEPEVVKAVDRRFKDLLNSPRIPSDRSSPGAVAGSVSPGEESLWSDAYLPALLERLSNPARPVWSGRGRSELSEVLALASGSPEACRAIVHRVVTEADPQRITLLTRVMSLGAWRGVTPAWHQMQPDDLRRLVRLAWGAFADEESFTELLQVLERWRAETLAALRPVLEDPEAPVQLRIHVAYLTAGGADASWRSAVLALLKAETSAARVASSSDMLYYLGKRLRSTDEGEQLLRAVLAARDLQEEAALAVAAGVAVQQAVPADLARALLERWAGRSEPKFVDNMQRAALAVLQLGADDPALELFARLLGNAGIRDETLQAMGRLHLEGHLPLLEEFLRGAASDPSVEPETQGIAAQALAAYLSDQAAEILLKGVGWTTNDELRQVMFDALETIRRYQDEKARWADRASDGARRDAAIAELVPLLADLDPAVRRQAARSLGALGAVDQLPALVKLLKDLDPGVRTAATEAIERLTAARD